MASTPNTSVNAESFADVYTEGLRYFTGEGNLNQTLAQLTADLKRTGIDYMVIGAVALFAHGYRRFTENIDLVLTTEGLDKFQKELLGTGGWGLAGYTRSFTESNNSFKSFPLGVVIRIMTAGEYPGNGKPKPVRIPEPSKASTEINGVQVVTLEKLIELKLASGISAPHRLKDLADVQELIKVRKLQSDFAEQLDPYVREKFWELHEAVRQNPEE